MDTIPEKNCWIKVGSHKYNHNDIIKTGIRTGYFFYHTNIQWPMTILFCMKEKKRNKKCWFSSNNKSKTKISK